MATCAGRRACRPARRGLPRRPGRVQRRVHSAFRQVGHGRAPHAARPCWPGPVGPRRRMFLGAGAAGPH
eukprot:11167508-Lingulodinium_polyedra.AAC.1